MINKIYEIKKHLLLMLMLSMFSGYTLAQDIDNAGEEFIMTFLPNLGFATTELHLTSSVATMVTVNYPMNSPTFTTTVAVNPGAVTQVVVPSASSSGWAPGTVQNQAVHAFADEEFVCYMINRATATSDAALALPVDVMNTEYLALTYHSTIVSQDRSELAFVAAFENTTVTITPSVNLIGGHAAGVPFNVMLDRGEAYLTQGTTFGPAGDLTGTEISSDKPIGMTNGNICTNVPPNITFCDHIFEVAQPLQTWGNIIFVSNLPNRPGGTIYRILASQDNTTITLDGAMIGSRNKGEFVETGMTTGNHVISADKPVFVAQFMTGDSNPGADQGDPAMGNMIPSEQYLNSYTFSTVGGNQFVRNFVQIIAPNTDLGTLQLDGVAIAAGDYSPVPGTAFSAVTKEISSGTHTTASLNPHGITVSGINNFDSYLYPGGARFQFINPVGDANPPICNLDIQNNMGTGTATDNRPSEDANNNDVLDPGEDLNGNGLIDEDTGIFFVVLGPGTVNLALTVAPFVPGAGSISYTLSLIDPNSPGTGTVVVTDGAGNQCISEAALGAGEVTRRSFIAVLLGDNETPPVETPGSGGGMFILNERQDSLWFWIRVCELECPLIASHFHVGAPGVPGPVVRGVTLTPDTMGSYFASGVWTSSDAQPLTPALVTELLNGNIYFNVHSTGHPGGEIRGQLTFDVPVDLFANLDGGQETPPVMTMGSGEGHFTLSGDGDSLEYSIMYGNLSGPAVASHFHKAAFGVPGPVVRGFSIVGDSLAEGVWTNMDAQPLTPQLVADLLGCFIYANIHTQQHPGGEIRGQLFKTETMMKQYMTIWAAENDADANQYSKLNFYSLAEGKQFLSREGDITGYNGEKRIADLTIDIGGNIYFLNNTWTSMLYRIKASAIDLDGSTPVYAKQIGRTRTFPDEKLVWLSHIQFIRGKLYGLDNKTNKLYEINQYNAYVKEIADLSSLDKMASGFALGADGNVYLLKTLDQSRSEIWKFDSFPGNSLSLVTGISSLDVLESFASHPNGRLYASDKNNLYEIDLSQRTVGVLKDHQVSISAMDFDTYNEKTAEAVATVKFGDVSGVTAVSDFSKMPTNYSLAQNYPNPFNPSTSIRYSLPLSGYVKLDIYNSLGEVVKTLVNGNMDAGEHEIVFNAEGLPSGIYIYRLESGSFVSSSKMILLK